MLAPLCIVTLSGERGGDRSWDENVERGRARACKAVDIERRKLAIEADFEITAVEEGSSVDARFFAIPKKARDLRCGGFAAETSTFRLTGAVLEGPAKGSRSSSGKDSAVSKMMSSQRKPPSLLLTKIGERLARRPLTGMVYDADEARVSPLSVKTVLCEISDEQNSEGTVGLVGDAVKVSDSDGKRHSREASGTEICGDADKSSGMGRGLEGTGRGLSTERGLGGNRGERGAGTSSNPREGEVGRREEDVGKRPCDFSMMYDSCKNDLSEGEGEGGVDRDECFSASPTISVCGFPTGIFSSERGEEVTDCCASPVNPSELGDLRETGRDDRASSLSLDPEARRDGPGERRASEGRGLETKDGPSRGSDVCRSASSVSRPSPDISTGEINTE
jgi:hypothetical protein